MFVCTGKKLVVLMLLLYVVTLLTVPICVAEETDVAFGKKGFTQLINGSWSDAVSSVGTNLTDHNINTSTGLGFYPGTQQSADIFLDLEESTQLDSTKITFGNTQYYAYPWSYKIYGSNDCYYPAGQAVPVVNGEGIVWEELVSVESDPGSYIHSLSLGGKTYRFLRFVCTDTTKVSGKGSGGPLCDWEVYGVASAETVVSELSIIGNVEASAQIKVSAHVVPGQDGISPVLIAAVYSSEEVLLRMYSETTIKNGELALEFVLPASLPSGAFVKAFVWKDGQDIVPMTAYAQADANSGGSGEDENSYIFKPIKLGGGGFVTGLVVHPNFDVTYCRTDVGGAYRWDGDRWTQLMTADRLPAEIMNMDNQGAGEGTARTSVYQVESIGVDPSNADVLYIAAGGSYTEKGILLKSINKGESFIKTNFSVPVSGNAEYRMDGERIAVNPGNPDSVFYGSRNRGLWRSKNGGIDWQQVPVSQVPVGSKQDDHYIGVNSVVFDGSSRIYASVAVDGIYQSDDGGDNWHRIYNGDWAPDMQVVDGVLYAAFSESNIKKYTPAGGWVNIPAPSDGIANIAVDPQNKDVIYGANDGFGRFYRSTNGGVSWTELSTNTGGGRDNFKAPDMKWKETSTVRSWLSVGQLVIDPRNSARMWFAEGMGVWKSENISNTNNAPVFYDTSDGIEELVGTDIQSIGGGRVVTANWDRIGFVIENPDIGPGEQIGLSREFSTGTSIEISPSDPNVMAMAVSDHRLFMGDGVYSGYSTDGGRTWKQFASIRDGVNNPPSLRFGEIAISAQNCNNMVWMPRFGEDVIYYSTNAGESWLSAHADGFSTNSTYYLTAKKSLVADGAEANKFYAYNWDPGAIYVSTDGGANWKNNGENVPAWLYHNILKNVPGKAGHLWLATGYDDRNPVASRGLYFSDDGGTSFSKISGVSECWAVGTGKEKPGSDYPTVFIYGKVDGEWGVYRSTDCGGSWDKCIDYPLGLIDRVTAISGDIDEYGKVYIAFSGNGFCYGYPAENQTQP